MRQRENGVSLSEQYVAWKSLLCTYSEGSQVPQELIYGEIHIVRNESPHSNNLWGAKSC
jgi:hypothetical protein